MIPGPFNSEIVGIKGTLIEAQEVKVGDILVDLMTQNPRHQYPATMLEVKERKDFIDLTYKGAGGKRETRTYARRCTFLRVDDI